MIAGRLTQQGDLQLQGSLNTRLPLVTDGLIAHFPMDGTTNSATTHFVAKAQNYPYETEDGIWDEYENIQLFNSGRSWHISVWDMYTNDWAVGTNFQGASEVSGAHARYDVYALTTQVDSFVDTINNLNNTTGRYMVVITGGHAAEANFSSSASMKAAIKLCGGTTSNLSWTDRRTYVCVGEVGCGEGNAQTEKLGNIGDVTLVVPFYCYSKATIDSNTTKTNEYVAIEEGTTNLVDPLTTAFSNWGGLTGTSTYYTTLSQRVGVQLTTLSSGGVNWYNTGGTKAISPSTTYTVSAKVKYLGGTPSPNLLYVRQYSSSGSQTSESGKYSGEFQYPIGDGWYKVYRTFVTDSTAVSALVQGYEYGANRDIWIEDVQLEQKSFATEYVKGSRSTSGDLKYPIILTSESTISFDYFCKERISNTVISNSNFNYWWGLYLTSAGILYTHTGHNGGSHMSNYTMPLNQWVHLTIKWTATLQSYYADGVLLGTIGTAGSTNAANIPVLSLGIGWNVGNALFKNVSIYNRALPDDEIKKLVKGTHSITTQGLITKGIDIKPSVPNNANYFPFDLDGKDYHKSINPTKEVNTAYVDGSVWVGDGTTNVVTNANNWKSGWSLNYNALITYDEIAPPPGVTSQVLGFIDNDTTRDGYVYCYGDYAPQEPLTSYTVSLYVKTTDSNFSIKFYTADNSEVGRYNSEYVTVPSDGKWHRVIWNSFTNPSNSQSDSLSFHYTYGNPLGETQRTWICAPQMEASLFVTPYVYGSRNESSLHLPYSVIDCKQDFTIYGWWYPKVLDGSSMHRPCLTRNLPDSDDAGNRILVMNGPPASSTKLFCFFGSGGNETLFGFTSKNILVNEWNFFALRRVDNNVLLSHGTSEGILHATNSTASYLNTDEVGQVWQVGEYSNSESNAYHKDYVFYQGSMTDVEIEAIFKTKMQGTKDGLLIQNSIRTNEIII